MSDSGPDDPPPYVPTERLTFAWLTRLQRSATKDDVLAAVLDLRDNAYDLPEAWERFTAVRFLQYLSEELEDETSEAARWQSIGPLLGRAIANARSDGYTNWG